MTARFPGRAWRRRAWFGLQTVLGLRARGYFLPCRYAQSLPAPGSAPSYQAVEALLDVRRASFAEVLGELETVARDLERIGDAPPPAPRWSQEWFPRLDAAVAYGVLRRMRPKRVIEVGSGHSTRFLARAVADGGLDTRLTAIDPAPRAALDGLPVELRRQTLHQVGVAPFRELGPGDLLLVDSSHLLMPGSDVDFLLGHVLPALPAGIWVHFHDVFLPDDYPAAWAWRGYNEQLGVMALVLGGGWAVRFASHYVATRMARDLAGSVAARFALPPGAFECGLWLEKTARAPGSRVSEPPRAADDLSS